MGALVAVRRWCVSLPWVVLGRRCCSSLVCVGPRCHSSLAASLLFVVGTRVAVFHWRASVLFVVGVRCCAL
jgi:hypothetical protein